MDLGYNVVKMETPYTQEVRQHEHHHQEVSSPETGSTGSTRSSEEASSSGMAMYFHISNVETILFKFWRTSSVLTIVGSCVVVFIVAILYELLKFYRDWLKRSEFRRLSGGAHRRRSSRRRRRRSKSVSIGSVDEMTMAGSPASYGITERYPWLAPMHWYQTFLHMLQVTISFMLMLVFMTFNVWLCLSVVLGAGLGYFIFFVNDEGFTEHCN